MKPQVKQELFRYVMIALLVTIIMLIGMITLKRQQPPKLVKVDLVAITQHYTQIMVNQTQLNNQDTVKSISTMVRAKLQPTLESYAASHKVLIIQSQAIAAGNLPDITQQIISQLDSQVK